MKIEVNVTPKDYGEFNKYYLRNKLLRKRFLLAITLWVFLLSFLASIGQDFSVFKFIKNLIITSFIFFASFNIVVFLTAKLTENLPSKNGSIIGKRFFICTEEYFIEESQVNLNQQKWSSILSIEETKNTVLIFIDKVAAYIIPKRDFKDEEQKTTFIDFVKNKINKVY